MFAWHEDRSGVVRAVTDRSGGVSTGRYAGLNLGAHVDDAPDAVAANRRQLTERLGRPVVYMDQCHGAEVVVLDDVPEVPPRCDGVVTRSTSVALAVLVADCVPVLLSGTGGVVAAVHAGRPGMVAGVVPRAVETMRALGATRLRAWVGPHVCGGCYEVPEQMRDDVCTVVPQAWAQTTWGTPALDIGAGVRSQLHGLGVDVVDTGRCTIEDHDLYSYRRQGRESGRLGGLVWVRP